MTEIKEGNFVIVRSEEEIKEFYSKKQQTGLNKENLELTLLSCGKVFEVIGLIGYGPPLIVAKHAGNEYSEYFFEEELFLLRRN